MLYMLYVYIKAFSLNRYVRCSGVLDVLFYDGGGGGGGRSDGCGCLHLHLPKMCRTACWAWSTGVALNGLIHSSGLH